jgi:hypothetical protein
MKVRVVYFEGCPNHEPTVALIREVAAKVGAVVEVEEVKVETDEDARRERLLGSPTVQVSGLDIDPASRERTDFSFSCRVYAGENGLPGREMIAAALTGRAAQAGSCGCSNDSGGCCG